MTQAFHEHCCPICPVVWECYTDHGWTVFDYLVCDSCKSEEEDIDLKNDAKRELAEEQY